MLHQCFCNFENHVRTTASSSKGDDRATEQLRIQAFFVCGHPCSHATFWWPFPVRGQQHFRFFPLSLQMPLYATSRVTCKKDAPAMIMTHSGNSYPPGQQWTDTLCPTLSCRALAHRPSPCDTAGTSRQWLQHTLRLHSLQHINCRLAFPDSNICLTQRAQRDIRVAQGKNCRHHEGVRDNLFREELKGTNYMGQTGLCKTLRFPAVFCENLRLQNAVVSRISENQKNLRKPAKNCELGSVCPI